MKPIEITNRIYTFFVHKDYRPKLEIYLIDDEKTPEKNHIQVQIDVDLMDDPAYDISTTTFFYALDDHAIYTSTVFFLHREVGDGEFATIRELKDEAADVYSSVIRPDNGDNEIHLFHEIGLDAFDETFLEGTIGFFHGDTALLNKLKELTKK